MKPRYSLQGYDPRIPLKDNLMQVKNFAELLISFLFATLLTGTQAFVAELVGEELAAQAVILVTMIETGVIYYALSAIEYYLKED